MSNTSECAYRAAVHLYLPVVTPHPLRARTRLLRSEGWQAVSLDTRFYMRYIDRIFYQKEDPHRDALKANCLVMENAALCGAFTVEEQQAHLTAARLYCFDTAMALLDLKLTVCGTRLPALADLCAKLRQTDAPLPWQAEKEGSTCPMTVNALAADILAPLGDFLLFEHLSRGGATRADVFTTVITEEGEEEIDLTAYRIADGVDSRYVCDVPEEVCYAPFPHVRWTLTPKGACSVGLLTAEPRNRSFVQNQWMDITENRHAVWYALVLHQKYAMYHYLNGVAAMNRLHGLQRYQKSIVIFNTEYRFEVIAEDATYQRLYQMARDAKAVENVFADIDEEIRRINDLQSVTSERDNVVAMTIVSLICAISTFVDIFTWASDGTPLTESLKSFTTPHMILLAVFGLAMTVALSYLVILPLIRRICAWIKNGAPRLLARLFCRRK